MKKNVFAYTGVHYGVCRINTKYNNKASMFGVMNNAHFGGTKVQKNGYLFEVPEAGINQLTGMFKVAVKKAIECPTLANIMHAYEQYGMTATLA